MNESGQWTPSSARSDSALSLASPPAAADVPNNVQSEPATAPLNDASQKTKNAINRTRTGCRTCRSRRIKCDEEKPVCNQCRKGKRSCSWPGPGDQRAPRLSRRPNATACIACRDKKLKCIGNLQDACERCNSIGVECVRSAHQVAEPTPTDSSPITAAVHGVQFSPSAIPSRLPYIAISGIEQNPSSASPTRSEGTVTETALSSHAPGPLRPTLLGLLPTGKELEDLVQLYFSSVHHFGYYSFIHQLHFNRLLAKGKAPRELTLMMIASAMRFAHDPTSHNLARADAWADAAIEAVLPRIYQGFGAVQLMTLLLAQNYDLNRGNFTSAWLLGANCTRMMQMMSLQTFDRTYPASSASNLLLSPLLTHEALRRVAWSAFYADTIVDGGRYGFHIIDEKSYRLQLPCDQASFLSNETVITEPLFNDSNSFPTPDYENAQRAPLDMSAYLLRAAAARRRALHFAFRASHKEQTAEQLCAELVTLEADIEQVINALPRRFYFNSDNVFLHRDRLITFILLHIVRHNLFIVIGRAALQVYPRDATKADLIPQVRRNRISHALPIAGLVAEGLKARISFDPQIGVQAYVALEILLFEPRRLAEIDPTVDPKAPELMDMIPHLLAVIREIADRSEFVKQLHIEAVHRLLRCDCTHLLNETDFAAFRSEYRLVGQDAAEYDFRDFRWAKLERIRRGARSTTNMARDEALLEYRIDGETAAPSAAPSPRLDAIDVNRGLTRPSEGAPQSLPPMPSSAGLGLPDSSQSMDDLVTQTAAQPWWGLAEPVDANQEFSLNWSWLLDESGHPGYQTGDPTTFWSQLNQI